MNIIKTTIYGILLGATLGGAVYATQPAEYTPQAITHQVTKPQETLGFQQVEIISVEATPAVKPTATSQATPGTITVTPVTVGVPPVAEVAPPAPVEEPAPEPGSNTVSHTCVINNHISGPASVCQ